MTAVIKILHGYPTVYIDDQPVFYGLMWGSAPLPDSYALQACAREYAQAGVHFYTFDIGTTGALPEWRGPKSGVKSHFDFSTLEKRFNWILHADPEARFHLRIQLEMPEWWQKLYPQECELVSNGRRLSQSFASQVWRTQANEFLHSLIGHIQDIGYQERVIAYQCGAGSSGEWVKGPSAMGRVCGDYSLPMQTHFRNWLNEKYHSDEIALTTAWSDPAITFKTATIPPADAQFNTTHGTFRDPGKEQHVIDYYSCLADLCADLLIEFCTTVKVSTHGKSLAGAFYGYLMELAWNAGFFGEGLDSEFSTYQRSGHLGLAKVLRSPNVDFLVSPYSYGFRGIGGEGCAMLPTESLVIHKKLYILEDDTRTHLSNHDYPNYGKADSLDESIAILKRNFAYTLIHGHGIWWLAGGSPQTPHIDLDQEPAFRLLMKQFEDIGRFALDLDRRSSAEIVVILDDDSFYYEWLKNTLDVPLIFQQRLWGLPHMGAPFDVFLLDDFINQDLKPYKLYIFLNAFHLERNQREALKRKLCKSGKTALWIYAPGYVDRECSTNTMTDLTGISFELGEHPWGPIVYPIDLNHPITRGISAEVNWGTNNSLSPVFYVNDPGAHVLGNVVFSQGRCRPGFVVKEFPEWNSVFSAAPNLPAGILRGIANYAGVHIYNSDGDTLYVNNCLLAVHTASGGKRLFQLPNKVDVIYDLFTSTLLTTNADRFEVELPPICSNVYYFGEGTDIKKWINTARLTS